MVDSILTNLKINGHVSVNSSAQFGEGCVAWQYSTICEGAKFGARCVIGSNAWVGKQVICGDDVRIQHGRSSPTTLVLEVECLSGLT